MKNQPYRPRVFLPENIDLGNIEELAPVFDRLKKDLAEVNTVEGLQEWLDHSDEVDVALGEEGAKRYIANKCQTDDPQKKEAYQHFTHVVAPWLAPIADDLNRQLAAHSCFDHLPPYYDVFRQDVHRGIDLYKEANIPRHTELDDLNQRYESLVSDMTIEFEGEEATLVQAANILDETDRSRRQAVFEKIAQRRLQDRAAIDDLYGRQIELRQEIAKECGFENYRDYMFRAMNRAYSPEDCFAFHKAIEEHVVPLARQIQQDRLNALRDGGQLGPHEPLRPWDGSVDPYGKPPLRPFSGGQDLFDKTEKVFARIDPRFTESFRLMREYGTTDLENHKGKAPGGFHYFLAETAVPFIFMNASGNYDNGETLKHENGHATHSVLARDQRLASYRHAPMEMCELASMSAELLCAPFLKEVYSEQDARRVRREQLEKIVDFLPWMATVDAFQHWVYTNPGHTAAQRDQAFLDLCNRFEVGTDWTGYEDAHASGWQKQSHIITTPFYYIDYGVSQLAALQVERNAKQDRAAALEAYFYGLKQGGSKPLAELYRDAGVKLDLTANMVAPLMNSIREELGYGPDPVPVPRITLSKDLSFERRPGRDAVLAEPDRSRQK